MKYFRFKRHIIRNDIEAALFFYDYILIFPRVHRSIKMLISWANPVVRLSIQIFFALRLNKFFHTVERQREEFLVFSSRENKYKTATDVMFTNQRGRYKVKKIYPSKDVSSMEMKFISKYHQKTHNICIPKYQIITDRKLSIEFIKEQTILAKIRNGGIKESDLLPLYEKVRHGIDELYEKEPDSKCLIHGDLNPANVLIHKGIFYLIDFADAHVYEKKFDKFTFLKELLYFYYGHDRYDIISRFFTKSDINKYKVHHALLKNKKFYG